MYSWDGRKPGMYSLSVALLRAQHTFSRQPYGRKFCVQQDLSLGIFIHPSFLTLGTIAQGELWPPEQSPSILIHPRLTVWFLNNLVFMV
jgi:hypothetical protein